MNKKTLILIAFLALTVNFYGQRRPDRDKIKSLKVAFITERLDLSSSEAESFWPIYNEHEEKRESLRKRERIEIRSKLRNTDELSEEEADKLLPLAISIENDKAKLHLEYFKKLKKVISSKKTILLIKAEGDFKKQLIKQYRHNKDGGGRR